MLNKILFSLGLVVILVMTAPGKSTAVAPPSLAWSPAKQIPGYPSYTEPPYLVADRNRTVHALHVQPVNDQPAIVYSTWTMALGWTMPVDVLLAPHSALVINLRGLFLDAKGTLHAIFVAGDDTFGGDVYYSRAAVANAEHPAGWSAPKRIGEKARMGGTFATALAADDRGDLYVVYSGTKEGNGLYEIRSQDGGDTWSDPAAIFLTGDSGIYPGTLALQLETGNLHIAWSDWRPPYGGYELYYARLDTERNTLSSPVLMSRPVTGNFTLPDTPSMILHYNTLFLVYSEYTDLAGGSMAKLMRQSTDHGKTWTKPVLAFPPLIGGNGIASLLVDSDNELHAVLSNRTGDCCHGMWYSFWEGNRWSESQAIISPGPKTRMFDPQIPNAVMSQGNVILATWINEERLNGVWYSYARLDAPELPIVPLPTPIPSPDPTSTPNATTAIATPTSATTRLPATEISAEVPQAEESTPGFSILIGTVPVIALIALIGLWRARR